MSLDDLKDVGGKGPGDLKDVGGKGPGDLKDVGGKGAAALGPVEDVLSRVCGLGGLLVVAFISPVTAQDPGRRNGGGGRASLIQEVYKRAKERDEEDGNSRRAVEDRRLQLLESLAKKLENLPEATIQKLLMTS